MKVITSAVISSVVMKISEKYIFSEMLLWLLKSLHPHISGDIFHTCTVSLFYSLHTDVKNCEGSGILLWIEANKLACHNFIDAGTSQETLGWCQTFTSYDSKAIVATYFHWQCFLSAMGMT